MFVNLRGESWLLWRAVDEHGAELDILLQKRRDKAAAKRFFQRAFLSGTAQDRRRPVTQLPGFQGWHPGVRHRQAHVREGRRPREQPRREQPSADPRTRAAHARISRPEAHSGFPIRQHFALKRHLQRASLYRKHLAVRFSTWREFTEVTQNPSAA